MPLLSAVPIFFAQATAPAAPAAPNPLGMFLPMVLLFGAMYFFLIAPQRKKQKEHDKMLSALGSGDEVVTTGGIYGTITNVKDDRFVVRISDDTKIEVGKGFIHAVVRKSGS